MKSLVSHLRTIQTSRENPFLLSSIPIVAIVLWLILAGNTDYGGPEGRDFYQMWVGARALLMGYNPYGSIAQHQMMEAYGIWGKHGLPYPIPAFIPIVPLAALPVTIGMWIWAALCLAGIGAGSLISPNWRQHYGIPLLFLPLLRTTGLLQPTLMWVALSILLIIALDRRWTVISGLCLALLPTKPQAGMIMAIAGGLWALRYQRRVIWWGLGWTLILWGGSFVINPNWVQECLNAISKYRDLYPRPSFLPFGLILVIASYRLPWWAKAAALQLILFPIRDVYSTLPLLIAWFAIGGPLAAFGAGISYIWLFMGSVDFIIKIWLCIFLPYTFAALWKARELSHKPVFSEEAVPARQL